MAATRKRTWVTRSGETKTAYIVTYTDRKAKRRGRNFATKKAADAFKLKVEVELAQGTHTADTDSLTLTQARDKWLETGEANGLERSTLRPYRNHVDLHMVPLLGDVRISRLTTPMIEQFKTDLLRERSRSMVKRVLTSLKMLLSDMQRLGFIAQNVAAPIMLKESSRDKGRVEIPDKVDMNRILQAASQHPGVARALLTTAAFTGLRSSEQRALAWSRVDLKAKILKVDIRADQWGVLGSPKSGAGHREIPLTSLVVNVLKEWKLACPKGSHDLVFPNGAGNIESHSNMVNRIFNPIQLSIGMYDQDVDAEKSEDGSPFSPIRPRYNYHALRHFYASLLIEQGFIAKRVQELMGHSTIQMTMDTYGHLFKDEAGDRARLAAIEAAMEAAGTVKNA